jgi:tetratricopeptide (TPR) repeat protein
MYRAVFLAVLLVGSPLFAETQRKKTPVAAAIGKNQKGEVKYPQSIALALAAVPLLSTDPEREAEGQAKIVEALVRKGEVKLARKAVEPLQGYRRGVCLGQISVEAARQGEKKLAAECLQLAAKARDAESDWRRERISSVICVATAEAGRFEEAFELLKAITEPDDIVRTRAGFARAYARVNKLDQANAQASEAKGGFSISTAPMQAEAFLEVALARERAGDHADAALAAHNAATAIEKVSWLKIDTARRAAELLHRLGKKEEAATLLEDCRKVAMQISDRADFKGQVLSGLAVSFAACGEREAAEKLLQEGERVARTLEPIFRCAPLAQLGVAWTQLGDPAQAERLWQDAARTAHEHKNPRVKGMGYISVCLASYEAGRPFSKELDALVVVP